MFIFDMDGTLTESRQEMDSEMIKLLIKLSDKERVVVLSGAEESQMRKQIPDKVCRSVVLFSQSGNRCPFWENKLTWREQLEIFKWIEKIEESYFIGDDSVEDRGCQISLSMVGHHADTASKANYDPTGKVRKQILKEIPYRSKLEIKVLIGGSTCFDCVRYTKGDNVKHIKDYFKEEILYVGDQLWEGGNDETVIGVCPVKQVKGVKECKEFICQNI